jgi:hypothetical protein
MTPARSAWRSSKRLFTLGEDRASATVGALSSKLAIIADTILCRRVSSWCVGIYRTRADLPLMARPTLSSSAPLLEEAGDEAKQSMDCTLSLDHPWQGNYVAKLRVCFFRRFGQADTPDVPRHAAEPPFWEAPICAKSGASSFCPQVTTADASRFASGAPARIAR